MKLVRVTHSMYINVDRIDAVVEYNPNQTNIFADGRHEPIILDLPIKKVLDAISGSEEHLEELTDKAIIEMLYKANTKMLETNELLLNKIKNSLQ